MSYVRFIFISSDECQSIAKDGKCPDLKALRGTLKLHAIVGKSNNVVLESEISCYCGQCIAKDYSCPQWRLETLTLPQQGEHLKNDNELESVNETFQNIEEHFEVGNFIAAKYIKKWYIGQL